MHIVKLIPNKNSKYHFGEGSLDESSYIFHSNSLFSAIVNNFIKLYGVDEFNNYKGEIKKLKISSLFPAIYKIKDDDDSKLEIEKEILFIPKPMVMLGFDEDTQDIIEEKPKDVKKIKFISIGALKKHNERALKKITIGKEYLISKDEKKDFGYAKPEKMDLFKKIIEQKVSIDRIKGTTLEDNEKGQLYTIEFIKPLRKDKNIVGFYFLIDYDDIDKESNNIDKKSEIKTDLIKKIKASINLIKDEGLGGKRSIGAGTFEKIIMDRFNNEDLNIKKDLLNKIYLQKGKKYISKEKRMILSIAVPDSNEEFENFNNYQLIKIGGYIYSSSNIGYIKLLKMNVYGLMEGSICNEEINGKILNLKPKNDKLKIDHEIILNGHPILIPVVSYDEFNEEGNP